MKFRRIISTVLTAAVVVSAFSLPSLSAAPQSGDNSNICELTVNYREHPLGIDTTPVFGWKLSLDGFDRAQSAYRITISDTKENAEVQNGTVWDSDKQAGENNYDIEYKGGALKSRTKYFWTVEVWDENDVSLGVSAVSSFETGVLNAEEWAGKFIQAGPPDGVTIDFSGSNWIWLDNGNGFANRTAGDMYARRTFEVSKKVAKAEIIYTVDDISTVYVNGVQIGLTSAWKQADSAIITGNIQNGENVIAVKGTNETVGYAGILCKLRLTYEDGAAETIISDTAWKLSESAASGWQTNDFDDNAWSAPGQAVVYGSDPWKSQVVLQKSSGRAAPVFRKAFEVNKEIKTARAYVSGLGLYDFEINGVHADDSVLTPANTDYTDTVLYNVYDITDKILQGENAVGVMVGHGFFNCTMTTWNWQNADWLDDPMLLMDIVLTYSDGTTETISTDETWKSTLDGPITSNDIYYGEAYDARLEMDGYSLAEFDDSGWENSVLATAPKGTLTYEDMEPMRRTGSYTAAVSKTGDSYIVTAPEMLTGWLNVKFNEARGTEITITYGEKLTSSGKVVTRENPPIQRDTYICSGDTDEVYEPRFSYKGYQYVQLDGLKNGIIADDVTAYRINNDIAVTGSVKTSDATINGLHEMAVRTMLNNFQGKPTDTPFIEKNGWLGDANVGLDMFNFNFNLNQLLTKFVGDMNDGQLENGDVPVMVPRADNWNSGAVDVAVWNTLFINGPMSLWNAYGNKTLLTEQYDKMRALALKQIADSKSHGWTWYDDQYADWVSPMGSVGSDYKERPPEGAAICGTAYVYKALDNMAQFADMLGKPDDAKEYRDAMENIYAAFNSKFYKANKGIYETNYWNASYVYKRTKYRQTSNIVALAFGLVPEEYRQTVLDNLLADIGEKGCHLDTGIVGTKYILPVLAENGYADVAYKILTQETYPSWGYWYAQGDTTLREMWEDTSRSLDHYFLGTYEDYLYGGIGGISDISDGYKTVTIKPQPAGGLSYANVTVETVRGTLQSNWTRENNNTAYDLIIPVGTTAKVYIPTDNADDVTVNGAAVQPGEGGVVSTQSDNGYLILTVGSGSYKINFTDNVTEVARNVESVALDKTEASVFVGDTFTLNAEVSPNTALSKKVTWSSSDKKTATVNASGKVTAVKPGEADITVKTADGGKTAVCRVTVLAIPVNSVAISQISASIRIGGALQLSAAVSPDNATNKNITWNSSDTSVALVDSYGVVTAVKPGKALITASADGVSAQCAVTVTAVSVQSVKLNESKKTLRVGEKLTLTATVSPANATDKTVTWSSSNKRVATVNGGAIKAISPGSAIITAASGGKTASFAVTVNPKAPKKLKVKVKNKKITVKVTKADKNCSTEVYYRKKGTKKYIKLAATKKTSVSKKLKMLKKGRYQVRARAYIKAGGKTYRSVYTKVYIVKVK